jgi:hypothetical protein
MGIGHIFPCETHHHEDQANNGEDSSSTQVEPSSTQVEPMSTQEEPITQEETHTQEQTSSPQANEQDQNGEQNVTTSQDQAQEDDHDQRPSQAEFTDHEGIVRQVKAATKSSGIMVDRILGNISKGVLTRRELAKQMALLCMFSEFHVFVSSFESLKVHEALQDPDWVISMQEELECFTRNKVWSLVERPRNHRINVIGTKWVFKNKQDKNGLVIRNKARLMAQGFAQIENMDYEDTFAPVA